MMYIYLASLFAQNHKDISSIRHAATLIFADNIQEAKGYALELVEERYPKSDWINHDIAVEPVEDSVITLAFSKMAIRMSNIK